MEESVAHTDASARRRLGGYRLAFGLALAANAFFFFSFQGVFPVLPRFIAQVVLNLPPEKVGSQVGLASAAVAIVAVFTRIPTGQLTDRFGPRRFMLLGALCFALAPLIYAASRGMPMLLLGRVVQGVGLGSFSTALVAFIAELAPASRRGAALGLTGASSSVAFISAPLVGDWLATHWGYTTAFNVSAATAAISVLLVALLGVMTRHRVASSSLDGAKQSETPHSPTDLDGSQRAVESGLRLALAQPGVRAGMLIMAALGIPFGAFITFLPLFTEERGVVGVGLVYSVYAATVFLAQPLSGWLTDRIGRHGMILPGLLITGLAAGMLSLDGALAVFALAGSVFGLGGGLVRGGVDPLVQDSVPAALRGTAAAVQYTSFDLWIGGGSYLIGVLATAIGYATTFAVTGVICVLGAAGLVIMLRQANRERRSTEPRVPNSHQ